MSIQFEQNILVNKILNEHTREHKLNQFFFNELNFLNLLQLKLLLCIRNSKLEFMKQINSTNKSRKGKFLIAIFGFE